MPKKRRFELIVDVERCGKLCPNFEHKDGMGYCEDWDRCKFNGKEVKWWSYKDGFPEWCPLKEVPNE